MRETGAFSNDLHAVEKWISRLRKVHGKDVILLACYEAGPCGFGLARRLRQLGDGAEPPLATASVANIENCFHTIKRGLHSGQRLAGAIG